MNKQYRFIGQNIGASDVIYIAPGNINKYTSHLPDLMRDALKFALHLQNGSLLITMPDGKKYQITAKNSGPDAQLILNNYNFAKRLFKRADLGIAESFIAGEWTSPDITTFLELFCVNNNFINQVVGNKPWVRWMLRIHAWLNRNTKRGSKKNISVHYDLGNTFYNAWLDPTMTYSSALFANGIEDLEKAQIKKYQNLAQIADFKESESILEIGCGWGGFAEFAAKEIGCNVTALTISKEQFDFAQERIFKADLNEKVKIKFQDYRDEQGCYDRIASIEMFEAVGEKYWPRFFQCLKDNLGPGGTVGLQVITIQDRYFEVYRRQMDFIRRYVFPGGMLPTPNIMHQLANKSSLRFIKEHIFGQDYAKTLRLWRVRFRAAWPLIESLGFDHYFKNLWEYYLHYCEAGFRAGNIDVRQMVFARN